MRSQLSPIDRSLTVETSWQAPVVKMREAGGPMSPSVDPPTLSVEIGGEKDGLQTCRGATFPTGNQKSPAEARPIAGLFALFAVAISKQCPVIRSISMRYQLTATFPDHICPLPVTRPSVKMG